MRFLADLLILVLGLLPLVAAVAVLVGGIRRLRGDRRGAFDRLGAVTGAAVGRGIYPESLRGGGPVVPVPRARPILRRRRPRA